MYNHKKVFKTLPFLIISILLLLPITSIAEELEENQSNESLENLDWIDPQEMRELVSIAVPDAKMLGEGDNDRGLRKDIADIIRRDLTISGYFEVLPESSFFFNLEQDGMTPATINFQNWQNVGAEFLIKAGFKIAGGDVKLDLRLFDAIKGDIIPIKWSPQTISLKSYRKVVHGFVNAIIEHFTGEPGIFGTQIVMCGRGKNHTKQIFKMDMDGHGVGAVTKNNSINILPTWGPGGKVFYTSYIGGNPDLYLSTGGEATKIAGYKGINSGASYCRKNGKIALTLSKDGNAEIYVMNPDGSGISRLTNNFAIDTSPSWSPDCSEIAFVSSRSGKPQIYVMGSGGGGQRRITFAGSYNQTPDWSPDGSKIAFTGRDERNRFDIFLVDPNTTTITRITQDQGNNEHPSFSSNGRYIVFASTRGGGGSKIYISTLDGSHQIEISKGAGFTTPSWSR